MNPFIRSVRKTPVPYGTAALWWLSQMGLLVKLGDTLLLIDYYATESPGRQTCPPVPAAEISDIDIFLGTHDHSDHIDHPSWRLWSERCPRARFVYPALHTVSVLVDGVRRENAVGMNDNQNFIIGCVTVRALAAAHEFLARDEGTGLYPCLQYIIEGNGVRLYHAGDTLRYEGMLPALRRYGHIDAALLPINGRDGERYRRNCIGNMTFQEAADLAGELCPGTVIPGHWDLFKNNSADPEAFRDYMSAKYGDGIRCIIPKLGEPIMIRAQSAAFGS